ncbi:UDP-3-O-[3-hydroxymyristoyl] N-acetylglucosamine deacetylase [compost metagenome]
MIGDLALVGYPLQGHLVVHRGGHALHTALAAELLRQRDAWQFADGLAADAAIGVPSGIRVAAH